MTVSNGQMLGDSGFIVMASEGYNQWLVQWWFNDDYEGDHNACSHVCQRHAVIYWLLDG